MLRFSLIFPQNFHVRFTKSLKPVVQEISPNIHFIGGFGPKGIMLGPGHAERLVKQLVRDEEKKKHSSREFEVLKGIA